VKISAKEARAIAITAQGFPRPPANVRKLVEQLGVVQIDSVNVLARSHYLPAFSRLGAYEHAHPERFRHKSPPAAFGYRGHRAAPPPAHLLRAGCKRAGETPHRRPARAA